MPWDLKTFSIRLAALGAAACSSAYAVQAGSGTDGAAVVVPSAQSPYDVELLSGDGRPLATYRSGDRFYVLGQAGERYSIRVTNPTARRVEAVLSVDGLDVIDGEDADFAGKRGYVVQPGADLVVDGFRMSETQVAAFRFSSVGESYADRKGKGRNVGVIGVAIFEEKDAPQIAAPPPTPVPLPPHAPWYGGSAEGTRDSASSASEPAAGADDSPAPPAAEAEAPPTGTAQSAPAVPSRPSHRFDGPADRRAGCCRPSEKKARPGLGTQWGEERYSAVDFTRFERANPRVPTAMAELRYNDAQGLEALGILVQPMPDPDDLYERESADPFPGARGFASPPR